MLFFITYIIAATCLSDMTTLSSGLVWPGLVWSGLVWPNKFCVCFCAKCVDCVAGRKEEGGRGGAAGQLWCSRLSLAAAVQREHSSSLVPAAATTHQTLSLSPLALPQILCKFQGESCKAAPANIFGKVVCCHT